jgi:hypothetical protein
MSAEDEQRQLARNESRFRKVNEGIDAGRGLRDVDDALSFVCECGQLGCTSLIEVSVSAYEAVRSSGRRFILRPDHVDPRTERVVDEGDGYVVAEKVGVAGVEAQERDPREAASEQPPT